MKQIVNEGTIDNNLIIESKTDADNLGTIENNNLLSVNHNFNNMRGNAGGNGGLYLADNSINNSPEAKLGSQVRFLVGNATERLSAANH